MKIRKTIKTIYLTLILTLLTLTSFTQTLHTGGQAQFKFWLAFEDSTGAKDTLWVVFDSSATNWIDSSLGELPIQIDSTIFQVYTSADGIPVNLIALNTMNKEISASIFSQNYHLPITVRWDSSLFRNNDLPWEIKTAQLSHRYLWPCCHNMLLTDSFIALPYTWGGGYDTPFPIGLSISELNTNSVQNNPKQAKIEIFPIPAFHLLTIKNLDNREIKKIEIISNEGQILKQKTWNENKVDVRELPNGIYYLKIQTVNQTYFEKLIIRR